MGISRLFRARPPRSTTLSPGGWTATGPPGDTPIQPGDGLVVVSHGVGAFGSAFGKEAPAAPA